MPSPFFVFSAANSAACGSLVDTTDALSGAVDPWSAALRRVPRFDWELGGAVRLSLLLLFLLWGLPALVLFGFGLLVGGPDRRAEREIRADVFAERATRGAVTLDAIAYGDFALSDRGASEIASGPSLRVLNAWGARLSESGVMQLAQAPELEILDLSFCERETQRALGALARAKRLRALAVDESDAIHESLPVLWRSPSLTHVQLDRSHTTRRSFEGFERSRVEQLSLLGCARVDDDTLALITGAPRLRRIDLRGTSVTPLGIATLEACPLLETIVISETLLPTSTNAFGAGSDVITTRSDRLFESWQQLHREAADLKSARRGL